MSLIPKGPHQGKVVVWDEVPVILRPGSSVDPNLQFWTFQAWSIVDPVAKTFRNFLLPLRVASNPQAQALPQQVLVSDIFCSGHCWTANGDLFVAGGTSALVDPSLPIPLVATFSVRDTWLFDPDANSQAFLLASPLYPDKGKWLQTRNLLLHRFYPTVTQSQTMDAARLQSLPRQLYMVSGGLDLQRASAPDNNYETYQVSDITQSFPVTADVDPNPFAAVAGPVTGAPVAAHDEEFGDYARIHLLSDGTMFLSGPNKLGAKTDLSVLTTATPPRSWDTTVGRTGSAWNNERHDGAAVFFSRLGALTDVVARLGGGVGQTATDTAEFCQATVGNASWVPLAAIPGGPRMQLNAVILPDASVLVIGGANPNSGSVQPVLTTALFRAGTWVTLPNSPSERKYHATAVLLQDGSVFVGGGEVPATGDKDYDRFMPAYMQQQRPVIQSIAGTGVVGIDPDGTTRLQDTGGLVFSVLCTNLGDLDSVAKVVFMTPGSITHHSDMNARYVEVPSAAVPASNNERKFTLENSSRMPVGYYMLFVLNSTNVPSEARWVRILP